MRGAENFALNLENKDNMSPLISVKVGFDATNVTLLISRYSIFLAIAFAFVNARRTSFFGARLKVR